jgi:hypothetical protein
MKNENGEDLYASKYFDKIWQVLEKSDVRKHNEQIKAIINQIYTDGYEDGVNNYEESEKQGWGFKK